MSEGGFWDEQSEAGSRQAEHWAKQIAMAHGSHGRNPCHILFLAELGWMNPVDCHVCKQPGSIVISPIDPLEAWKLIGFENAFLG